VRYYSLFLFFIIKKQLVFVSLIGMIAF